MKKTLKILIVLMPFVLFSCFEFVGGANMSKRILNLAIAAPADVSKIHIAVFDGAMTPDRVIYKQSFVAGSSIPLDLPTGINRIVVVWAEGFSGTGIYYGSLGPVTIQEGDNTLLPIQMIRFHTNSTIDAFNLQYPLKWNAIPGAFSYELQYNDGTIQVVTTNSADHGSACCEVTVRVLNSIFDIPSDSSNPYNFG